MKFRLGACAAVVLLAACSGQKSDSQMAALHGSAGGDSLKSQARSAMKPSGRDIRHSIASAPDRGALMAYKNQGKPVKREGAFTYYPVAMSEDHALKGVVTGHMTVPMPDGSEVKLNYERHDEGIDGNWTWVGRVEGGDPMQEAIITFGEEAVFASIPQGAGKPPLNIRTQGGSLYAVQMDPSKVRSPNIGHNDMAVPEASTLRDAMAGQILAAKAQISQKAVAQAAPPTSANTIDVAVGYTAGFRNKALLTQGSVTTALTYLLQIANQGFSNSNVNGYLRLVNAQEVSYTDSNSNETALHELTGSNGKDNVTIPTALAPLRTARDQYGADIALLIRGFQQPEHQGCGIAWLIGANGATVNPAQDERWGYGVVSFGDDTGTDGNSYYCAPESMVHEVGHLLGSAHDRASSTTPGRYPYSYGYKSTAGNFYTIMAYGDQNQTPYRLFSNPNIATCGQASPGPCGVANEADNARSLNQTIPVVALFRATAVPFTGLVQNDIDGDRKSDLTWYMPSAGLLNIWAMNGSSLKSNFSGTISTACSPRGHGDFNGDSLSDVIFTCAADRSIYILFSTGSGYVQQYVGNYASGWAIINASDVNGDGKSDVLWHNASTGVLNVWLMNGAYLAGNFARSISTACIAKGFGDLNGDGRADVTWTCAGDNSIYAWLSTGSAYTQHHVGGYAAGWSLVSNTDVNGDGKSDLLWYHQSTGLLNVWIMNGIGLTSNFSKAISPVCTPRSFGDFNGDTRYDVAWTCIGDNSIYMWTSTGSGYTQQFVGNFGASWALVN